MEIILYHFRTFFIVFSRVSGLFVATPVFASQSIPMISKGTLAFFISLILYPIVNAHIPKTPDSMVSYLFLCGQEVLIGLIIGLTAAVIIQIFQISAEFYSTQIGFGIMSVFDPLSENNIPLIGHFQALLGLMIFLLLSGDAFILMGLKDSFVLWETISINNAESFYKIFFDIIHMVFIVSFQIGAPLMATMFLISVASGLLSRAAPQMNILIVELPIKIVIGLLSLAILMPIFFKLGGEVITKIDYYIRVLVKVCG
ncbi:MAG: flagellar biosynthetic protein FliR [Candidatus Hydrogenedentota bacterium]